MFFFGLWVVVFLLVLVFFEVCFWHFFFFLGLFFAFIPPQAERGFFGTVPVQFLNFCCAFGTPFWGFFSFLFFFLLRRNFGAFSLAESLPIWFLQTVIFDFQDLNFRFSVLQIFNLIFGAFYGHFLRIIFAF